MTMTFDEPDPVGGDRLNPKDCVGHLLMVWAVDYIPDSPTKYSRPDRPSDVVVVDVVNLDQADENGFQGALYRRCWWRQARLIAALKGRVGKLNYLLARMTEGVATMGKPPFELYSCTNDPGAVGRASMWLEAHRDFRPSGQELLRQEWQQQSIKDPSPLEQAAEKSLTPGQTDYLSRLAQAGQQGVARLTPPPPPPPPQNEEIPF